MTSSSFQLKNFKAQDNLARINNLRYDARFEDYIKVYFIRTLKVLYIMLKA